MQKVTWLFILTGITVLLFTAPGVFAAPMVPVAGQAVTPEAGEPGMMGGLDRLAPPPTVENPTQADQGAQVYHLVCMVCHGDQGQGLTEEWRNSLGPPDNNCWQSGCHQTTNIQEGTFKIPRTAPPVKTVLLLEKFSTAAQLHGYLQATMPWHDPGYLQPEEYWQLTAYLLRLNGRDPGRLVLDEQSAKEFLTRPPVDQGQTSSGHLVPIGLAAAMVGGVALVLWWRYRRKSSAGKM